MNADLRAALTVTADASQVVTENRKAVSAQREFRREVEATAETVDRAAARQARAAQQPARPANSTSARGYAAFDAEQAEQARRAYQALEASINPVVRIQREFAQAQNVVNAALARGQISATEASRTLSELDRRYQELDRSSSLEGQRARAMDEETRAVRGLMQALDPAARASAEFSRAQDQLTRAVRLGIITQEEATRSLALMEAQQQAAGRGGVGMAGGIQNASYQLTDFVVQVQAGQSASLALAQQLPQLLGGFGALGAVLGLVVALGVPLVSMLIGSGDAAGDLDDRLQRLETASGRVSDSLKILQDQDLAGTFGDMTQEVRALTAELLKLERASQLESLRQSLDKLLRENIDPGQMRMGWEGFKSGLNALNPFAPLESFASIRNRVTRENYGELTGGRGPSFDEFETRRSQIVSLAEAGEVKRVVEETDRLIREFAGDGPISKMNAGLRDMLLTLGDTARQTAEVEAGFSGSAEAARELAELEERQLASRERLAERAAAARLDGDERIRLAQQELGLVEVIARYGEESKQAEAERDRIARENLEIEMQRAGIYGDQQEQLLAIWDRHNAVADATAEWEGAMSGVRGQIEGILSAIASLGGGMVQRAAKVAELKALEAGSTIAGAAAAGQATRREITRQGREQALGGGLFGRVVAGAESWWQAGNDQIDAQLKAATDAARLRERPAGGGRSRGGGSGEGRGLGAVADIKAEIARLKPSYDADIEAADAWRAKALAGLKQTQAGYAEFAADVETIYQEKLSKAYEADLARRDDWAAGVERAQLKMKEDMTSWADFSEEVMTSWAQSGEDAFTKFVTSGKATLGDFVDFVAEAFARMAYQQMIQPGLGMATDWIGGLVRSFVPAGGAGASLTTNHTGSPGVKRSYALAGYGDSMRPDEQLTMMRKGEEIMTSRALENAGALISAMTALAARSARPAATEGRPGIQVITNTTRPVEVEERETVDSRGQRQSQLVISEMVATGLQTRGGAGRKALATEYGIKGRGNAR